MRWTVIAAAACIGGAYLSTQPAHVVMVERQVTDEAFVAPWEATPPVVRVTEGTITFNVPPSGHHEGLATIDSVLRGDALTFRIEALRERLQKENTPRSDWSPRTRRWHERTEECVKLRDERPDFHLLCPGRTIIVELGADLASDDGAVLLKKIRNTAFRSGYHVVVSDPEPFPDRDMWWTE